MLQSTATKRKIILSQELQKMERKSLKAERRSENQEPRLLSLFISVFEKFTKNTRFHVLEGFVLYNKITIRTFT